MMEALTEKEQNRNDPVAGAPGRNNINADPASDSSKVTPALERKISKRREAQEERNVVLDLFKELVGKVNEGYSRVIAAQNNKAALSSRSTKASRTKQRTRPKEIIIRESKERVRKSSSEDVEGGFERKEEIWSNYSKVMTYEVLMEEEELQLQPQAVPQAAETQ